MLAIDPPICRRQRRLQCDLQCLLETRLRTDLWYSACYFYLQNNYVKAIANWSMALAVSSKCSEHTLLAQECVKASLAMLTNTSHLSWRADLVILEEKRNDSFEVPSRARSKVRLLQPTTQHVSMFPFLVNLSYTFDVYLGKKKIFILRLTVFSYLLLYEMIVQVCA